MMATVGDENVLYKCVYLATFQDHLNTLKMILIKACDISNECRPIMVRSNAYEHQKIVNKRHTSVFEFFDQVSEGWVDCLLEEYFHQSDKEKKDALPVAPFMDR